MSHPDLERNFEEVFYDCMYSCIRDAGISLTVVQLERFQDTCKRSAKRLELKMEHNMNKYCSSLQERTAQGFEKVEKDVTLMKEVLNKMAKLIL